MDMEYSYCPIIKGKLNDIKAVASLAADVARTIKPLFEMPPFKPSDDAEVTIARFVNRLANCRRSAPCYVDFPLLKPGARTRAGESALAAAYGQLQAMSVEFEPVYGFDRDDRIWPMVAAQANRSGGLLLRLDPHDLDVPDDTLDRLANLHNVGVNYSDMDVMLDMRAVASREAAMVLADPLAQFIRDLSATVRLRKLVVAGSCAPKTVTAIQRDATGTIERGELILWASLIAARLPLAPVYGDYGVVHPDFSDLTISSNINGKIRYTCGASIHIFRGHSLRQGDKFGQYRVLSKRVVDSHDLYRGSSYSEGDRYIFDCSTNLVGTGNAGTWVFVDQNHHMTYAARQISRLKEIARAGASIDEIVQAA